jgi:hypothetical protein
MPNAQNCEDLKCGIVYIPPIGSKFSHPDPFYEIQQEIFRYCNGSNHILLFGDFNSRSGNLTDYERVDTLISDMFDLQVIENEEANIITNFELYNVPINRKWVDQTINYYGTQLIDLCKNNDIYILNGRAGSDKDNPRLTCKNSSTVDYFLATSYVFQNIVDFHVEEYCSLYSDVHCPLFITLKTKHFLPIENLINDQLEPKTRLWDSKKADVFIENLDVLKLYEIETKLDQMIDNDDITQNNIDNITSDIANIFNKCALETFGTKTIHVTNNSLPINKQWFNNNCHTLRDKYHRTRKMYNKYKTHFFKTQLKNISKQYKNALNKANRNFKLSRVENLKKLKTTDPKQYWNIINLSPKQTKPCASLEDFYTFFKSLNENSHDEDRNTNIENDHLNLNQEINEEINCPITESEILAAVKCLKNNKSPGTDNIVNEHIKSSLNVMMPIYLKLFNVVFDKGIVPLSWTTGSIKPIYKNKGNPKEPENYRPISLLSCFGKLFTSILNNRLNKYADSTNLIHETQAGFRKKFSTIDNIFILKSLIDIVQSDKKKLYCCFVDLKQAFDSVWRIGLWKKLKAENITGKCFNVINSLYSNIKSRVTSPEGSTPYFDCLVGVRQGENLSPFLFSIFLNDLDTFLSQNNVNGVSRDVLINGSHTFIKLFVLLYADDTVIFSDNDTDLQNALDNFKEYCEQWKLKINTDKTKIMIFSKGRFRYDKIFKIGNTELEIVDEYKYLGLYLSKSGSFYRTKQHIAEQGNKAMFTLLRKINKLSLPYDLQIELFDKTVKPILLYGSEIWGFGNLDILEKVQLKFFKYIFKLKKSTPTNMIYGELGVTPIEIHAKNRLISFWSRLIENIEIDETTKLSAKLYSVLYKLYSQNRIKSLWLDNIKQYLCNLGFPGIWDRQIFINSKWLIKASFQKLKDIFIQKWHSEINNYSSSNLYKYIKANFVRSRYIDKLPNYLTQSLISFLTRNHHLPIETGRWRNIPSNERKCPICNDIGDEYHYMLICPIFKDDRKKYINANIFRRPSMLKFIELIKSENYVVLKNLSIFCSKIIKYFKNNVF